VTVTTAELDQVARALGERYQLTVDGLATLPGEIDRNVRVETPDAAYVLKLSPPSAGPEVNLQVAVLDQLARAELGVTLPRVVRTVEDDAVLTLELPTGVHLARLLSWVPGLRWRDAGWRSAQLRADLGALAARVGQALAGFDHPALHRHHGWDLRDAADIVADGMAFLADPDQRRAVDTVMARYHETVPDALPRLPRAVTHHDLNDANVLVARDPAGAWALSGVIDVGDVLATVRVAEPAVAAANAMLQTHDPVAAAVDVAAGFHAVSPLDDEELAVLLPMAGARLCMSLATWTRRQVEDPGNGYPLDRVRFTWPTLRALAEIPAELAQARLRAGAQHRPPRPLPAAAVGPHHRGAVPLVGDAAALTVLDLSPGGDADVEPIPVSDADQLVVSAHAEPRLSRAGRRSTNAEPATVHLGVDVFGPEGTPVHAPLPAGCESADGGRMVLRLPDGTRLILAGLTPAVAPGTQLPAGTLLGTVTGRPCEPTGPAHLHVQLSRLTTSLPPVFVPPSHTPGWLDLCPDPTPLLLTSADPAAGPGRPDPPPRLPEVLSLRARYVARSQRAYYRRPMNLVRGRGVWLTDEDGLRYLDAVNNVTHVGHGHPRVVAAAARQMHRLNTNSRFLYPQLARYAHRLTGTLPDPLEVVFFVCTGSEANDLALRIARTVTGRADVVVIDGAYHGNTTTVTGISPNRYKGPGGTGAPGTTWEVPTPDRYRGRYGYADPDAGARYASDAADVITAMVAAGRPPAAVIAESLMGTAGQIVHPPGYLDALLAATRRAGGLAIVDEVQVGLGRLGPFWGFEAAGVVPDIVTMGKPMGNGHPLAAVVTTREIADTFDTGMRYFNTFGGNPVSCAIGLAVLDVLDEEDLPHHAATVGAYLRDRLTGLADRHPLIGDVRGQGLYLGIELVRDRTTREPAAPEAYAVCERMKDEGVIVYPNGVHDNVLKVKPPMVFNTGDADAFTESLERILSEGW